MITHFISCPHSSNSVIASVRGTSGAEGPPCLPYRFLRDAVTEQGLFREIIEPLSALPQFVIDFRYVVSF